MVKRLKIGLIYSDNKDWVAGTYYILNLVHALNTLDDKYKPVLTILSYTEEEHNAIKNTGYPYLSFVLLKEKDFWASYNLIERVLNKILKTIVGKQLIYREHTKKRLNEIVDIIFPASNHIYFSKIKHKLFWIPDFQEHFLPHFFSANEIEQRKSYQKKLSDNKYPIVFSSNNALNHFKGLYPNSQSKIFVLQFAVTHPHFKHILINDLKNKYSIDKPYFFCPNQFWAHKNHITVLKSIVLMVGQGQKDILVVFSGKENDHRNPKFFSELKTFISTNEIEENVRFLGFIDRCEQLQLMDNAISVIQPSLFEGWSTVIEDAKSMGQFVIASDLDVHREQLKENCVFFDPQNENELTNHLLKFTQQHPTKNKIDYQNNVKKFGEQFTKIANKLVY